MRGARVEEGAQLEHCILSPGAVVSANVSANGVILGDDEHLQDA